MAKTTILLGERENLGEREKREKERKEDPSINTC
jgi:hypothetical protein